MNDHEELIKHHCSETGETYFEDRETKMFYDQNNRPFESVQENYFHQFEGEDLGLALPQEVVEIDGKKHIRTCIPEARVVHLKPLDHVRRDFKDPNQEVGGFLEVAPREDGVEEPPPVEVDPRPAADFVDPPVTAEEKSFPEEEEEEEESLNNPGDFEEEERLIDANKREVVFQHSNESEFYIETLPQQHRCLICQKIFDCKKDVISHYKESHPLKWEKGKKSCPFPTCKRVGTEKQMMLHIRVAHTNEKPFRCRHCGKGFKRSENLPKHEVIHTRKCDKCGQSFKQADKLANHIKSCNKGHKCPQCGKAFTTNGNLKKHIESVHCTVRKFSCEKCGKGFKTRGDSKKHHDKCTGKQ